MSITLIAIGSFIVWEAGMSMWYSKSYKAKVAQVTRVLRIMGGIAVVIIGVFILN